MTFEELMKLKVGDRIVAKGKTWVNTKAGDKGTVVFVSKTSVIIKWDNNVNGWGDSIYDIKNGHGDLLEKIHVI